MAMILVQLYTKFIQKLNYINFILLVVFHQFLDFTACALFCESTETIISLNDLNPSD